MRSSNASAPCRFELRPSRWLIGAILALTVLAPLSVLRSDLPRAIAWSLAVAAALVGAWSVLREARRPPRLVVLAGDGTATVDGESVDGFRVAWRGALAFVSWRDRAGRVRRHSLWPDTLAPSLRRELRLATHRRDAGRGPDAMAP